MSKVMNREEYFGGNFFSDEEVSDVSAGESATRQARAIRIEWSEIMTIFRVSNIESFSISDERGTHTSISRGHDAIEHVNAGGNAFDEIPGSSDAHEVAREIFGHLIDESLTEFVHFSGCFTDGEATDGEALEGEFDESFEVF